jgi:hypothetical protein
MQRPEEEGAQLWAARIALWQEVAAALDEDPAGDKAQQLCAKWAELAERSSGGDPEVKAGNLKEWRDHANWPTSAQQRSSSFRLEEVVDFIKRAYVCRAKKQAVEQWRQTHQPASTNP